VLQLLQNGLASGSSFVNDDVKIYNSIELQNIKIEKWFVHTGPHWCSLDFS